MTRVDDSVSSGSRIASPSIWNPPQMPDDCGAAAMLRRGPTVEAARPHPGQVAGDRVLRARQDDEVVGLRGWRRHPVRPRQQPEVRRVRETGEPDDRDARARRRRICGVVVDARLSSASSADRRSHRETRPDTGPRSSTRGSSSRRSNSDRSPRNLLTRKPRNSARSSGVSSETVPTMDAKTPPRSMSAHENPGRADTSRQAEIRRDRAGGG